LRKFIEAIGGRLEIDTHFPEGDVSVDQFETRDEKALVRLPETYCLDQYFPIENGRPGLTAVEFFIMSPEFTELI
jgi:hypothetical protein